MNCKCGGVAISYPVIECSVNRWIVRCAKCQKQTQSWILENSAIAEWDRMQRNFPTCDTCENYRDDFDPNLCTYHDRGTEDKWTCPDHLDKYTHEEANTHVVKEGLFLQADGKWTVKEDVTIFDKKSKEMLQSDTDTHEHNKNLLDAHFGASTDELLQGLTIKKEIDYKVEFLKLEKDYFEDVADIKADLKKAEGKATYWFEKHNEAQEDIKTAIESYEYWQKKWREEAEQNEKLNMLLAKIVEIVEG